MRIFFAILGKHSTSQDKFLSSGNIIAFSTPSSVGTPNGMLVACLIWPENNFKLCYLS